MSYNNRIQNIEESITKLEQDGMILSTRNAENQDTATTLINEIVDDVNSLNDTKQKGKSNGDLKELKIKRKIITEKLKIAFTLMKKKSHFTLEELRLQSNIIRKISPTPAEYLDKQINELEKMDLKLLKNWKIWSNAPGESDHKGKQKEREDLAEMYYVKYEEIIHTVQLFRNCIKDTLDKIKKYK